jgi:hypothetical protein
MMKRFLSPRQWRVVLFMAASYAVYEVISIFVKRAYGWNPWLLDVTNSPALSVAFSVIVYTLCFAALIAVLTHYMYGPEDEKGRQ